MPSTKEVVLENAARLLRDALLLFDHGRYPLAASIAVLSIEEFGKAVSGMSLGHLSKQRSAASFGAADEIIKHLENAGWKIQHNSEISDELQQLLDEKETKDKVRNALESAITASRWRSILHRIHSKEFSEIKNKGFYVDLDEVGFIKSVPTSINKADARQIIEMAIDLLGRYE